MLSTFLTLGVIGPILVNEMENYIKKNNLTNEVHCLKISHVGRFTFKECLYIATVFFSMYI